MKNILLSDKIPIINKGLAFLIEDEIDAVIIEQNNDLDAIINMMYNTNYDLIIIDINFEKNEDVKILNKILIGEKKANILLFTSSENFTLASKYFNMGIKGFLEKETEIKNIIIAINTLFNGLKYYSSGLQFFLANKAINGENEFKINKLSKRELDISMELITGKGISELCEIFKLRSSTIGTHKKNIFKKANVQNVVELYKYFKKENII
jgi:DNA-binding NarL/FixJ family response regulator